MRERVYEHYVYCHDVKARNPHCLEEMPMNHPSKLIAFHCKTNVVWLQEPANYCGHKPTKGGRRMVSGLVRASLKEQFRRAMLNNEL